MEQINWNNIGNGIIRGLWNSGEMTLSATLIGSRFDVMTWSGGMDKIKTIQTDEFKGSEKEFKDFITAHADIYTARAQEVCKILEGNGDSDNV